MKARLAYIDLAKFIAIFLVVWGHCIALYDGGYVSTIRTVIYTFHMPLFMIMSGFFAESSFKRAFTPFVTRRFKQLLVPTASCTLICVAYLLATDQHKIILQEIIGNSWFLKTLFVIYALAYFVKRIKAPDIVLFLVSWGMILLIPHSYSLQFNWMYPYFWIGILINKYREEVERHDLTVFATCVLLYVFTWTYTYLLGIQTNDMLPMSYAQMSNQWFGLLLKFVLGISGSVAIIMGCRLLTARWNMLEHIADYGKYTLGIYVVQTFVIVRLLYDFVHFSVDSELLIGLGSFGISLCMTGLCIWIVRTLVKNKAMDFLLFGGQYHQYK